ncbi:MAG: type II secretion system protein GspD [Flavobacteriaceae bacterium]
MKNTILFLIFLMTLLFAQGQETKHIQDIKNNLEVLAIENPSFNQTLKLEVNVANATLANFLMAVSKMHGLNLSVAPDVGNINIINNFANVTVRDLLVFLCKEYNLTIDFTGSILSISRYNEPPPIPVEKTINVDYNPISDLISLDLNNDPLDKVFRKIMEDSKKNLLYNNALKNQLLYGLLKDVPFDKAMEKLADLNGLDHSKSRDGFYLFSSAVNEDSNEIRGMNPGTYYEVLDTVNKILNVDFKNSQVAQIIESISHDLKLDVYTATPLEEAGEVTFNARGIYFDDLLTHIFESRETTAPVIPQQDNPNNGRNRPAQNRPAITVAKNFTFKKENNIYFFGTTDQLSLRKVEIVQMMHRSVELLSDPSYHSGGMRTAGRTSQGGINYFGGTGTNGFQGGPQGFNNNRRDLQIQNNQFNEYDTNVEALVNILPDEIKSDLDIKVDFELNSFFVGGPAAKIERFKNFIKEIDRPVPVVLIEVMIIEVRKSSLVETGISWGIGEEPVATRGNLYPSTDITLGAKTINKVIGGFDGFGSFNIGKVVPEFFATIKAMEENGNIKIRSTPKLSTLNGHRANLSIGETTYYVITNQNFFGAQIPTSSEIRNYAPIDAELGVSIKPLVSGDGQVTLDISVIQSDFSGERIEDDAPPGLTSREFSSIIRMQNQDLAILGGLEEKIKNDSGSGVPLLARVPVIKWLFSKRKREDTKQKLTILIKPTVIY